MISYSGISIFLFGNKWENGKVVLANGVKSEYELSLEQKSLVIPVGATGYMAHKLWSETLKKYSTIFGTNDNIGLFKKMDDKNLSPDQLIELIIDFITKFLKN